MGRNGIWDSIPKFLKSGFRSEHLNGNRDEETRRQRRCARLNVEGMGWSGMGWSRKQILVLMLVIAQQIVEKKGNNHDFARTG
jgi:hypothetical protein